MADIFLSYARKDLSRVKFLIDGLTAKGWTVWWDAHITPGNPFPDIIEQELSKAKCIVVVWSRNSVKSNWVKNEARIGMKRQALIPVMIDNVGLPIEFSHLEAANLKRWSSDTSDPEQNNFVTAVQGIIKRKRPQIKFSNSKTNYSRDVFLNCPFDQMYKPLFNASAFTILNCGFRPRTTFEVSDAGAARIQKIFKIISECKYGIHDISRTELNAYTRLPSFNIPLELGLFLGAQKYAPLRTRQKQCLVLDRGKFRYQQFISDLAGIDVASHEGDARTLIAIIRNWLLANSRNQSLPGARWIWEQYRLFTKAVPKITEALKIKQTELTYPDYIFMMASWLRESEGM
jgi:hypothetical protein